MDKDTLADKVFELADPMTLRALELPQEERSDFVTRQIAMLRASGKYPDEAFLDRLEGYVRARISQVEASGGVSLVGTG
jgi:hypothetical protein